MLPTRSALPYLAASFLLCAGCDASTAPDEPEPHLWIGEHKVVLRAGEEARLTAIYLHSQLSGLDTVEEAAWRSSASGVLAVRRDGSVTALAPGVATVSVEHRGKRDAIELRVIDGTPAYRTEWATVAVGSGTTCATTVEGEAYCWGDDYYGAVADGARRAWTGVHSPVRVAGKHRFAEIGIGTFHVCARTPAGAVYCWGDGGAIGRPSAISVDEPVRVDFDRPFSRLDAGANVTCGLDVEGTAYCWGFAASGELGDGILGLHSRDRPHPVATDERFAQILVGGSRVCALTASGQAYCWGSGSHGDLGTESNETQAVPVPVSGDHIFEEITGSSHTCGQTAAGTIHCWGANKWHKIDGDVPAYFTPSELPPAKQFDRVIAGTVTTCGLTSDGTAHCWGLDRFGNLGAGGRAAQQCDIDLFPCSDHPLEVAGGLRFETLSLGAESSCGVTVDGALYCWGSNRRGRLGAGSLIEYSDVPVRVVDPW